MPPMKPVAIVDDDATILAALSSLLRSAGYTVLTFPSAETFLADETETRIACLITDIQMPGGMSGLALRERVAARAASVPVILMSGLVDEATRDRARASGALAFLQKPVDSTLLLDHLDRLAL